MKKLLFTIIVFIIAICLFPISSFALTGYVSDMLLLTFRQGPGNSYTVIKTLKSNTPVKILEEQNGFYKVELTSQETGWVNKKYIIFTSPKTMKINELKKENENLSDKIVTLESNIKKLQERISFLKQDYSKDKETLEESLNRALEEKNKTTTLLSDTKKKYDTLDYQSKNIQKIIKENTHLKEQIQELSVDLATIEDKNKNLLKTGMIKWFLTGSGVLLFGWIIGQSVSSKKRHTSSLLR